MESQRARTFNGLTAREWTLLSRNVWSDLSSPRQKHHLEHGAVFPLKLAQRLITIYSREGDFVFDPFLGVGTTCVAAMLLNRRSMGVELNPRFAELARLWIAERSADVAGTLEMPAVINGDCREHVKSARDVQLTVTSPPYANFIGRSIADRKKIHKNSLLASENNSRVRVYSDAPNDLGNLEYPAFLDACEDVLASIFEVTRSGGYAVWVVKDHRLPPEMPYVPLHSDLAQRAQLRGWKWHDLITWDQNAQRSLVLLGYPSRFYTNQNSSFLVVLRKP
ncbi:MAG TPA: DNA methyltransferase [Candidatus Baltobacteraceae bacterium]|nr:DNA methyltransferase [Candidatus Baltobacteraceae bacterium]